MSKTYRRTIKGHKRDWLPDIHKSRAFYGPRTKKSIRKLKDDSEWLAKNPHRKNDVGNYFHDKHPAWWINERHTRPCRVAERNLLIKLKRDKIDFEDVVWPTNKKPHHYYW